MPHLAPVTTLATHIVANQPPDFAPRNLYLSDPVLRAGAVREGGEWVDGPLATLGAEAGTAEFIERGETANRYPPELRTFDRWGRRIDEVRFHPAYHALMEAGMRHGIHSVAWTAGRPGAHVLHAAMLAVFTEAEAGAMCPVSMTYASVPVLRRSPELAGTWLPKLLGGAYDPALRPVADKAGVTVGMAMTEKQGGSDVRTNTTRAEPDGAGDWRLTGHKWFCSAPMSDAFLTLAQTEAGLSCFFVPRVAPDGSRNAIHLMRLKDKLGNRSNASAEVEYHGAWATPVGEPGRGVTTIVEMVHHTRLDTMASTLGLMRMALAQAAHHAAHRVAFGATLSEQPAMRAVLADLALDYEAAVALTFRVARAFDGADDGERALARLAVALGKFVLGKRAPGFIYECMECLGGNGYVEEGPMPRLYREAPLNSIWEGSGNIIALDVERTRTRAPAAFEALRAEVTAAAGGNATLDAAAAAMFNPAALPNGDAAARWRAERLALVLQGSLLVRYAPPAVADAFCTARLGGGAGTSYGSFRNAADPGAILERIDAAR